MYKTAIITYTYGNGLISDSRKEAKGSDTEKRYYHYNHIGSTTAITDADGDLLYRIAYGTYGELTGIYDADGQKMAGEAADQRSIRETLQAEKLRFLYNGRYGVETGADGLYYMRARYYNPQIKRFINRDIIDGSITDSQSLNKYSYVQGNPISLVDPFGLCAQDYFSRVGHELLDWLGFIFDPADAINFLWYTAEGNTAMAAATAVAIVPAAGSFIAKGTKQAIKAGKKAAQKAGEKAAKNATEKAAKKAAKKKLAKEAGKEAAEKGAEKAAKEAAEKATEKTAKETAEKTAKAAAEKGIKSGSSSRYDRTGYQSKGRSNNLFGRDRSTRRTTNLTEWRRSISQQDIHNEMRLFLGDDYVKIDSGKWRSLDGTRQFRVKPDDYLGNHGIGQPTVPNTPHVHFEFLTPKSNGNGFDVIKNIHVPIK